MTQRDIQKNKTKSLNRLFIYAISAILLIVLILVVVILTQRTADPIVIKVNDSSVVTKNEYKKYTQLAQKYNQDEQRVEETLVEYKKNQEIAKKYNINIPDDLLENAKLTALSSTIRNLADYQNLTTTQNEWLDVLAYNLVVNDRIDQTEVGGWIGYMFDFSYLRTTLGERSVDTSVYAKEQADKARADLIAHQVTNKEVLDQIRSDEAFRGANKSGLLFGSNSGVSQVGGGLPATSSAVLDPEIIKSIGKLNKIGPTKVEHIEGMGYYFANVLYNQKQEVGFRDKVTKSKDQMKVVKYEANK